MSIGSIFTRPEAVFPARQIATDITVQAEQTVEFVIEKLKAAYHSAWGVSGVASGSVYDQSEMQKIIDKMDLVTLGRMRVAAGGILTVVRQLCIEMMGLEGADQIVPEAYLEPAWELTTQGTFGTPDFRVIVGELKTAWVKPPEEESE